MQITNDLILHSRLVILSRASRLRQNGLDIMACKKVLASNSS